MFEVGDRIRVKENGNEAKVLHVKTDYSSNQFSYREYKIMWDGDRHHFHSYGFHSEDEEHDIWELSTAQRGMRAKGIVQVKSQVKDNDVKELQKMWYEHIKQRSDFKMPTFGSFDHGFEIISDVCQHEWADYVGFSESYQYCRKCDEKRHSS